MRARGGRGRFLVALLGVSWVGAALSCVRRDAGVDIYQLPVLSEPPRVRVGLLRGVARATVAARNPARVVALPGWVTLREEEPFGSVEVRARDGRIVWGGSVLPAREVVIVPRDPWLAGLSIDGGFYRGEIHLLAEAADRLTVVNHLGLEDYLTGVLGGEVPLDWPLEAIKAQAVASRTYALYRIRSRPPEAPFDLSAGTDSQVYAGQSGMTAEKRVKLRAALDETRGRVLTFGRRLFQANFHAICGGHTDPAWLLVGGDPVTPLRGVPCGNCAKATRLPQVAARYAWSFEIPETALRESLSRLPGWEEASGPVLCVAPVPVGPGGHAGEAEVTAGGRTRRVPVPALRGAVGWDKFLSSAFTARRAGDVFRFEGKGWGHGGGLCQWGAWAMAQEGFAAGEILAYYYPGSVVARVY